MATEWAAAFDRSWLGDDGVVANIDGYVRGRVIKHRGLPVNHPAPAVASVELLVADARRFATEKRWRWAIASLAFVGELIICAEQGTPSIRRAIEYHERNDRLAGLGVILTPLILVRNALAHPASSATANECFPDLFVDWCERNGETELGRRLRGRWQMIGSEDVFAFALRRLHEAGPIVRRLG